MPVGYPSTNQTDRLTVYADRRWPSNSSIGAVQAQYDARLPAHMRLVDLEVPGRIGSPLSPLHISRTLPKVDGVGRSVFFSAGFMPPLWCPFPSVVVVHDLSHRVTYGLSKKAYYDVILRPLLRRCAAIVCVSEYTRSEFLKWSGMDPARVHVVLNGAPTELDPDGPKHDPGYPYIFYCGHRRPHKNLPRMIEAFCKSQLPKEGVRFILTNSPTEDLIDIARRSGAEDRLVFSGFLSQHELHRYYRGAQAVVYASIIEGFGLPILEGFSANVPVLTSQTASMPEVAGGAAVLVDPYSVDDIADGMEKVVGNEDLRQRLVARGAARLMDFDWKRSGDRIWEIVEAAAVAEVGALGHF